jgi:hypothetical protein
LRKHLTDANPLPHYRVKGKILVRRSEFVGWMRLFRVEVDERRVVANDTATQLWQAVR